MSFEVFCKRIIRSPLFRSFGQVPLLPNVAHALDFAAIVSQPDRTSSRIAGNICNGNPIVSIN